LADGGTPPRFLIIDDGWQQIGSENKEESANAVVQEGAQYVTRRRCQSWRAMVNDKRSSVWSAMVRAVQVRQ
jgi:hypothetical protein